MSDSKLKVLISGSVHGKLNQLFTRVNSINKRNGPFDLLLCVGDFFGNDNVDWQKCLDGVIKAPLQTYILGPMSDATVVLTSNSNGCELCENITYLGKKGLFTGSSGLKIAYFSGRESDGTYSDETITFSTSEAQSVIESIANSSNFQGVDILLSSQWPNGVEKYASPLEENDSDNFGSSVVSYVAKMLKPRYHFVSYNDILYERQPYRNHQVLAEDAQHVTRFISLSSLGNTSKKKWLYAFSITPLVLMDKSELRLQPPDVSEMPYRNVESKIETNKQNTNDKQYFYDMSAGNQQSDRKRHSKSDRFNDERKAKRQRKLCGELKLQFWTLYNAATNLPMVHFSQHGCYGSLED
ncbi:CWF19L1 (predicted) [Pycnogonum litorale]